MFKILVLFFLLFNYKIQAEEPIWYKSKPDNTKLYLYSSGVGKDMNDAILDALNNMIIIDDNYSGDIHINFTNYTIEDSIIDNNKQYVLVAVKRNELFNLQIDNLKILNEVINNKYKDVLNSDYKNKKDIQEVINLIEEAKAKIKIIKTINTFDTRKIDKKYNEMLKNLNNIDLSLNIDNKTLSLFDKELENILINNNIKFNKKSNNILTLDIDTKRKKIHNSFIVYNKVTLYIINNGKIIKYNYKDYESISNIDFKIAYKNNILRIKKDLNNIFIKMLIA